MNCKYGQDWVKRNSSGMVQQGLSLDKLRRMPIPKLKNSCQNIINMIIEASFYFITNSETEYQEAQSLLLSELGLENWKPEHQLSYVRNYSETVESDRIDAEYFQPKYDEIIKAIKKYRGGWDIVRNLFKPNKSTFKKIKGKRYNYLEISSINVSNGEIEFLELDESELPANAKIKLKNGDLVVSKVRTYRGAVALIDRDDLVGSGAFTVLHENGFISKEILFVLLKSLPYLHYSLKFNTGTSYPTIIDDDILDYPIPLFDEEIQTKLIEKNY